MREWLVTADDRTGAFEAAAEVAGVAGPVIVTTGEAPAADGVVDVDSRHRPPGDAAGRLRTAPVAGWNAHKIDSTLRGNWPAELRARAAAAGRRVLVIPAWPAMGRTCVGGVVHVHGVAIGTVADRLAEAVLLSGVGELRRWLAGDAPFGAVDVPDTEAMLAVAAAVASSDLLVAGPAGPIGAAFAAHAATSPRTASLVRCDQPALVVRGSATEISCRQVARLQQELPAVDVVAAPPATGELSPSVAARLAGAAAARLAARPYATVVIIGGDTAAAVLGDAPRLVGGTVLPGMPWSRDARGGGPLVVTKAGGFGGPDALVDLFRYGA